MDADLIVIGNGIFGSMIAKYVRNFSKKKVLVIDSNYKMAASKCSAGIFKKGWINKNISAQVNDISLPIVSDLIGIEQLQFYNENSDRTEIFDYVNVNKILIKADIVAEVIRIKNNTVVVSDGDSNRKPFNFKASNVVIAAGIWTDSLLNVNGYIPIGVESYWGQVLLANKFIKMNKVFTWAPYKQCTVFQRDKYAYFGNGVTVKKPKAKDSRIILNETRLVEQALSVAEIKEEMIFKKLSGFRPYLPKEVDFINKHDSNLYSATGGAKNSTILCGYIAKTVFDLIK